jgi:hypothetical protein
MVLTCAKGCQAPPAVKTVTSADFQNCPQEKGEAGKGLGGIQKQPEFVRL